LISRSIYGFSVVDNEVYRLTSLKNEHSIGGSGGGTPAGRVFQGGTPLEVVVLVAKKRVLLIRNPGGSIPQNIVEK
jgi:hypothetical protein